MLSYLTCSSSHFCLVSLKTIQFSVTLIIRMEIFFLISFISNTKPSERSALACSIGSIYLIWSIEYIDRMPGHIRHRWIMEIFTIYRFKLIVYTYIVYRVPILCTCFWENATQKIT